MDLDLKTLFWVMSLASFVLALSVLFVASRNPSHDGLLAWGWGLAMHFLSYPVFALRLTGWVTISIVLANLLTSATIALHTHAVVRFQRKLRLRPNPYVVWMPVGVTVLLALLLAGNHAVRIPLVSAIGCAQAVFFAWLVWSPGMKPPREQGRILLFSGVVLMALLLAVRTVLFMLNEDWSSPLTLPEAVQTGTYLTTLVFLLLNTMGFVLMQKERGVEQQHQLALHDPLTGIHNRRALMEEMERFVSQAVRHGQALSMLMVDIDFFKRINDSHGHQTGDEVLKAVAQRIGSRLRREDFLARFGGEEFVVALPDTDAAGARSLAEDIRLEIAARPVHAGGVHAIDVTVSVGWFTAQPSRLADTIDHMISGCDAALYEAKHKGRNRVEGRLAGPM